MLPFVLRIAFIVAVLLVLIAIYLLRNTERENRPQVAADFERDPEIVLYGVSLIDEGHGYYPDWSAAMLREFDGSLQPLLEQYYDVSQQIAELPSEEWNLAARDQIIVR